MLTDARALMTGNLHYVTGLTANSQLGNNTQFLSVDQIAL